MRGAGPEDGKKEETTVSALASSVPAEAVSQPLGPESESLSSSAPVALHASQSADERPATPAIAPPAIAMQAIEEVAAAAPQAEVADDPRPQRKSAKAESAAEQAEPARKAAKVERKAKVTTATKAQSKAAAAAKAAARTATKQTAAKKKVKAGR